MIAPCILICFMSLCCCTSDYNEELSGNYLYFDEGSGYRSIYSHSLGRTDIYSTVTGYAFNKDYIVVAQKPNYDIYKNEIAGRLRENTTKYSGKSPDEITKSLAIADSILKNDPFHKKVFAHTINYWIISNKENNVYGPLTEDEYLQKRKELNVPEGLKIESTD